MLAIELAKFGQMRQKNRASAGTNTWGAAEDFILFTEVVVGSDVFFDNPVEFGNLIVEGFNHLANAFTNPGMKRELTSVGFLNTQVNELSAATYQIGQFACFGAGGQFWLWLNDLGETRKDCCIDGVGLGKFTYTSCEVTDLPRGGNYNLEVCLKQFGNNGTFVSSGCFENYKRDSERLKGFDELFCARGIVGQRYVDRGGTRGDVECVFGNVDADEKWFCHGLLPILQMRTRRPCGLSAVPAAVRVSSIAATRIMLYNGLMDQGRSDLSSPASFGSARYARLTERRIYYRTFNHDICQHTRRGYFLRTLKTKYRVTSNDLNPCPKFLCVFCLPSVDLSKEGAFCGLKNSAISEICG